MENEEKSYPDKLPDQSYFAFAITKSTKVWLWKNQGLSLYRMRVFTEGYEPISRSTWFPDLDPNILAQYVNPEREPQMLKAFRHDFCQKSSGDQD